MSKKYDEAMDKLNGLKGQLEELYREIAEAEIEATNAAPVMFYTVKSEKGYVLIDGLDLDFVAEIANATFFQEEDEAYWEARELDGAIVEEWEV